MRHLSTTAGCRRRTILVPLALCASLAILALAAPSALADRAYDSQITGFSNPWGVTIDSAGHPWIIDPGHGGLISEYDAYPSQTKVGEQTGGGHYGATYVRSLAVNSSNDYLYVADSGPVVVDVFDNTGIFSSQLSHGFGNGYLYVAADNSSEPSAGRIYVAATSPRSVQAFDGGGNPVNFSGSAGYISGNAITGTPGTPGGPFGEPWNIATDSHGNIYVVDKNKGVVDEFAPTGTFVQAFTGAGVPGGFSANLTGVAVDPTNDDVLVVDSGNQVVDEFDSSAAYLEPQLTGTGPSESIPFGTLNGGIAVNSSGYVYLADGGIVAIFTPNIGLPKVTYGAVTDQTQTTGTLNASIDLNGGPNVTSCAFEYGTTTSYGSSAPCSPATPYSGTTAVSAGISGLTPETAYHYRVVVSNANGTKTGADQTYLPHAVAGLTTNPATNVDRDVATLNGSFNGNGEDTHYYFDWGTDTSYGNKTAVPPGTDAGSPSGPQSLTFNISGLQIDTFYHYRVVASNASGTSYGLDQSFKTPPAVASLSTDPATEVTASAATLKGSFNGNGEDTHYYFEWGTDSSYGNKTAVPPGADAGSPSAPQSLSFELGQLQVDTTYLYRIVASNPFGTTFGSGQSFTTLGRYSFSTDYGSAGAGDGQLANPQDVAVDSSSGDIYVADTGNHRVVKFDSAGNFLAAWGWGVSDGSAASQVCASGCQAGIPGSGDGQFTTPAFIEVDNSSDPSAGDVYVADTADGLVHKFDPSGNLIADWGSGGAIDFSNGGGIGGITVDSSLGNLFVLTTNSDWAELGQDGVLVANTPTGANCSENGTLALGTPSGKGIDVNSLGFFYESSGSGEGGVSLNNPTDPLTCGAGARVPKLDEGAASGLAIDRSTNDLYVDHGTYINQFPATNGCVAFTILFVEICDPSESFGTGNLSAAAGLAVNPSNGLLYAANAGANDIAVFTPLPVPDTTTGGVSSPGPTSATLTGHVDPHGAGEVSDCYFEYGTDTAYGGGRVPCSPAPPLSSPADVSADLNGLQPSTTYHYRLVAIRADGKGFPGYGRDRTFTPMSGSAPGVSATSSSGETQTTATLSAEVNPNFAPTIYRFQYGTGYGSQTLPSEPIGEDGVDHPVSAEVSGLVPGTTYHFRVLATNFNGVTAGPDLTFNTPAPPAVSATAASAITKTAATLSAQVRPGFRPTGFRFEYGTTAAYGSSTPQSGPVGSDNSVHPVSAGISGLSAGSVYHFRMVATNAIGTTTGPDLTLSTEAEGTRPYLPGKKCRKGFVKRHGKCVKRHVRRKHRHG